MSSKNAIKISLVILSIIPALNPILFNNEFPDDCEVDIFPENFYHISRNFI